jgi:hypothetical protein
MAQGLEMAFPTFSWWSCLHTHFLNNLYGLVSNEASAVCYSLVSSDPLRILSAAALGWASLVRESIVLLQSTYTFIGELSCASCPGLDEMKPVRWHRWNLWDGIYLSLEDCNVLSKRKFSLSQQWSWSGDSPSQSDPPIWIHRWNRICLG